MKLMAVALLLTSSLSTYASCPQSDDRSLETMTFDFTVEMPPSERKVACDSRDKGKNCTCAGPKLSNLAGDRKPTFTMVYAYNFGRLERPNGGGPVDIRCDGPDLLPRTPTLAMVREYIGNDKMISNCTFATRPKYPDELLDQKQTSQAQGIHSTQTKTASDSNVQSSLKLNDNDRRLIIQALQQSGGDPAQAARKLGISQKALLRKMKESNQ